MIFRKISVLLVIFIGIIGCKEDEVITRQKIQSLAEIEGYWSFNYLSYNSANWTDCNTTTNGNQNYTLPNWNVVNVNVNSSSAEVSVIDWCLKRVQTLSGTIDDNENLILSDDQGWKFTFRISYWTPTEMTLQFTESHSTDYPVGGIIYLKK